MKNLLASAVLLFAIVSIACESKQKFEPTVAPAILKPSAKTDPADRIKQTRAEYDRLMKKAVPDWNREVMGPKEWVCVTYWNFKEFDRFMEVNEGLNFGVEDGALQGVYQAKANGFAIAVIKGLKSGVGDFGCHEGGPNGGYEALDQVIIALNKSGSSLIKLRIVPEEFHQLLLVEAKKITGRLKADLDNDRGAESQIMVLLDRFSPEELGLSAKELQKLQK